LGSASALEYAAQAAAAHGALLGAASSTDGAAGTAPVAHTALLAAARAVELKCLRLDGCGDALLIEVHRQHAEGDGALYDFELRAGALLARGRLTLLLS
jgi:predicted hotdog family 3-hydroxylacyl-ACP dehydratase